MSRTAIIITLSVCLLFSYNWMPLYGEITNSFSWQAKKVLKNKLPPKQQAAKLVVNQEVIVHPKQVIKFYQQRNYDLAWLTDQGLTNQAVDFLEVINKAEQEGLKSADYHCKQLQEMIIQLKGEPKEKKQITWAVNLDLLLTDAFFTYSSDLLLGQNQLSSLAQTADKKINLINFLQDRIKQGSVIEGLAQLKPKQLNYNKLKRSLINYQKIAANGGWPQISGQDKLQQGDYNQRVVQLRQRLVASGDLKQLTTSNQRLFTAGLEQAVRRFQYRHGLEVTGVVGKATLQALNVSAKERVQQIKLNLDRLRQLPRDLGAQYIMVNIPDFQLKVVAGGKLVRTMKVIVGKPARETPMFSDKITYLVFNPYWNIPRRIAINDLLPILQNNPQYLTQKNIEVLKDWGTDWKRVNPQTINWSQIRASNFDYRLRQQPGPKNALGQVKFIFPNKYSVYLHDTPAQQLFKRNYRAFSSGCIRISKPVQLARYLLQDNSKWTAEEVIQTINQGERVRVKFKQPIPVYLVYLTAWINEDGTLQFRNDIYNRDKK